MGARGKEAAPAGARKLRRRQRRRVNWDGGGATERAGMEAALAGKREMERGQRSYKLVQAAAARG